MGPPVGQYRKAMVAQVVTGFGGPPPIPWPDCGYPGPAARTAVSLEFVSFYSFNHDRNACISVF